jgi:hypothetical protein
MYWTQLTFHHMWVGLNLLAVAGGVKSHDALWVPLHAEAGPQEDHTDQTLQNKILFF